MDRVIITAPAKINLMLDVAGKRNDGYHDIITIMQSISLSDTISIERNQMEKISIKCTNEDVPKGRKNLAYRAAEVFLEKYGNIFEGLTISISKEIPMQAGLGGGSADAAAVLCGLNKLFETNYSLEELCKMGAAVGADVPFCIVGGTKLCRGIGDVMSDAPALEDRFIVIGKCTEGISTEEAYAKIDSLGLYSSDLPMSYDGTVRSLVSIGKNVFENVAGSESINDVKNTLISGGAEYAAMTGSGSAVFGLFSDKPAAELCSRAIRDKGFFSTVCFPADGGAYDYMI